MKFLVVCCIFCICAYVFPQTIREQVQDHFFLMNWVEPNDRTSSSAPVAVSLQGGSESFPLLKPSQGGAVFSIPPAISGLGVLDYSEVDDDLVEFCTLISKSLESKKLDAEYVDENLSFLSVIMTERLSRLEKVFSVYFSRPVIEEGGYVVRFRIEYQQTPQRKALFYTAQLTKNESKYRVIDFYSDGNIHGR